MYKAAVFRAIEEVPASGGASPGHEAALETLARARREADRIVANAGREAEHIGAQARADARATRRAARKQAFRLGVSRAERLAERRLAQAVSNEMTLIKNEVGAFCDALVAEQARVWESVQPQLAHLALEIAARVVKAELSLNPDVVVQITRHALRRLEGCESVRIRVNPDDVEKVRARREEILGLFEGLRNVEINEERRVAVGGVQIETDAGTLDARIETQIAEIGRAFSAG